MCPQGWPAHHRARHGLAAVPRRPPAPRRRQGRLIMNKTMRAELAAAGSDPRECDLDRISPKSKATRPATQADLATSNSLADLAARIKAEHEAVGHALN